MLAMLIEEVEVASETVVNGMIVALAEIYIDMVISQLLETRFY